MLARAALVLFTLSLASCDCAGPIEGTPCDSDAECGDGLRCSDGVCVARADGGGDEDGGGLCGDGRDRCSGLCCAAGEACSGGVCRLDCSGEPICGGECCEGGEECLDDRCVAECADEARRCGAMDELCCSAEQACLGAACVDLGEPCEFTEECDVDDYCELSLMRCVPRDAIEVCEFHPPVGEFTPRVACRWQPPSGPFATYGDVVMTPGVMNLTDDNGDGETNTLDVPDVVFVAFDYAVQNCCTPNGRLVIASGACNADGTMRTHAIIDGVNIDNSTGVALGNLHPDTMPDERAPEIVVTMRVGAGAFVRTADDGSAWTELWRNPTMPSAAHTRGGAAPSLADLDGAGAPEVIIGNVVLNGLNGEVVWDGRVTVGTSAGVGNNAFLGPSSTVADLDLDGDMEVIAGNTVYDGQTGAEVWTFTFGGNASPCGGSIPCDGFNAVGDFDDDPEGEVVIVRRGEVFVLQHTGEQLHRVRVPLDDVMPYRGNGPCANGNESGPPTIADFDGDGRPEIGTAGADFYVVVDFDCTGSPLPAECERENILWMVPNQDCSSRATGSSVFDFEGDGAAEVVYADETSFRIFDGRTGAVLYRDDSHTSNTRLEMPIVVDVDNDGKSEVLVPVASANAAIGGLFVWQDAENNWVRTRRVWNQHAYHVTNITEDGQVPRAEEPNWRNGRLNNFRQNVQPGGLFDAPDLTVTSIEVGECLPSGTMRIAVTVRNQGALSVPPGIAVWGRVRLPDGTIVDLGVERTSTLLLPGRSEVIVFTWDAGGAFTVPDVTFEAIVDDDGTGEGAYNECDESNNGLVSGALMTCSFG